MTLNLLIYQLNKNYVSDYHYRLEETAVLNSKIINFISGGGTPKMGVSVTQLNKNCAFYHNIRFINNIYLWSRYVLLPVITQSNLIYLSNFH